MGIQCGELNHVVKRIMFALDASGSTVEQALASRSDLLVTHHPLLFQPLKQGMEKSPAGMAFVKAVQGGLAIYSAHTNLDASPKGINSFVSELLQVSKSRILYPTGPGAGYKVVVYVPHENLIAVRDAAFEAGGGRIGNYSHCSFSTEGEGTFKGDDTTSPAIGVPGKLETVKETRLEILVPEMRLRPVLNALRDRHPYEEPAIHVLPLSRQPSRFGIGLTGQLPARMSISEIAAKLKRATGARTMRLVGNKGRKVRRVAICAGSGSSLMEEVMASGAELFITGDVKYHQARTAEEKGLSILDVGHFSPERYGIICFGRILEGKFREKGWKVVTEYAKEKDPFAPVG